MTEETGLKRGDRVRVVPVHDGDGYMLNGLTVESRAGQFGEVVDVPVPTRLAYVRWPGEVADTPHMVRELVLISAVDLLGELAK